jgi:hypothetical protein
MESAPHERRSSVDSPRISYHQSYQKQYLDERNNPSGPQAELRREQKRQRRGDHQGEGHRPAFFPSGSICAPCLRAGERIVCLAISFGHHVTMR